LADPAAPAAPAPLSQAQLDELVAPVALYPDVVLDSLLPATSSPADVAAAARYAASSNGTLSAAPAGTAWDKSVVALLQFPDLLKWLGDNPDWVEQMGFAISTQQADVLAAIQRYRAKAKGAGALASNQYETVTVEPSNYI